MGFFICVVSPIVLIGGILALAKYLRSGRLEAQIGALESDAFELRTQNLELLHRLQRVESQVSALEAHGVSAQPQSQTAASYPETVTPDGEADASPVTQAAVISAASDAVAAAFDEPTMPDGSRPQPARGVGAVVTGAAEPPAAEPPAAQPPPAQPPPVEKPGIAWEQWIGVRGAAALGASILVLAGIYFFEYSIEHDLISPAMRMVAGTLVGLGCVAVSELRLRKTHEVLASWIAGAGIAILYTAFWAGKALYELYPTWAAGLLMVATTGACVALAMTRRSKAVALLGLFGGFITPLALSTGHDRPFSLFGYLLLLDGAMLFVAYRRRWAWLAALCLLGTGVYEHSWLIARLDEPRLILGVAIVGVFTLLFGLLPRMRPEAKEGEEAPADESLIWRLCRSAGVFIPLMFTLPLAARTDLGDTFAVTAVQLIFLSIAACVVGIRYRAWLLPTSSALVAAFTIFARSLSHPPTTAVAVWQPVGLALGLLAVYGAFAELSRLLHRRAVRGGSTSKEPSHLAEAASVLSLTLLALAALTAPFTEAAGPWPWLLLWAAAGVGSARLGTLLRRPWLQIVASGLVAVGLGATFAHVAGAEGQPSSGVYLGCIVGAAVLAQFGGLLPFRAPEMRRYADHGAALFAVLAIPLIAFVHDIIYLPTWALYASTLGLAVLALFAAARAGSSLWLAAAAVVTAGTHGLWVTRRYDGPFDIVELATLGLAVALFSFFPIIAPKRMRDEAWSWRTAAIVGPLYFLALRHVYVDALGSSTIGLLPIALGVISIGAATAVKVRGPDSAGARKTAIVWLTATAAGFVTLAIPLQLSNEWITIGWAMEALALTGLWRRLDHAGLKYLALALLGVVGIRLLANPYVLGYYERSDLRILNWLTYTYLVPAICFAGMWLLLRGKELERLRDWERWFTPKTVSVLANVAATTALFVVFAWVNLTIIDWFATGAELHIPVDRLPARDLSLSIAWGVFAIGLLALGMMRKSTALRGSSLLLILITCAKVFLYDLANLSELYRVASLVGLALSLIIVSLAYQRFVFRDTNETNNDKKESA